MVLIGFNITINVLFMFRYIIHAKITPYRFCYLRNMSSAKRPVLYGDEASPPVRFAMMTASFLNIDLKFHKIDLFKSENRTEYYEKINPLRKVPVLFDDGRYIRDSHAIALYLCRKYNDKELYPQEIELKSKIDEMLFFNSGTLFPIDSLIFTEYFAGKLKADEIQVKYWYSALDHLEHALNQHKFLSNDKVRLCDLCCATTVSSLGLLVPPLDRHIKLKEWLLYLEKLSCYKINYQGLQRLQSFVNIMK